MKKLVVYISLCISLLSACSAKREKVEGEPYNPFDTSEQMEDDSANMTINSADSFSLPDLNSQQSD